MADPFSLSTEYQKRLDSSTFALDNAPKYFMEGLKIPGMISQNRTLGIEAQNAQEQLSSTQQLKEMMEDPRGIANSFGELKTADEMRKHMAKYSAIAITPMGQRIMGTWDKITSLKEASEEHSIEKITASAIARKQAEKTAAMIDSGIDVKNPHEVADWAKDQSFNALVKEARLSELVVDPNDIRDEDWLPGGGLKSEARRRLYANAKPLPHIESANQRASDLLASRESMAQEFNDLRRDLFDLKTEADLENLKIRMENNIEVQELRNEARVAISEGQVSREQFINRQLNQTVTRIAESRDGRKLTPEAAHSKAIKLLGESFDREIFSRRQDSSAPKSPKGTRENPHVPQTINDVKAIPSGEIFRNPKDGRLIIKGSG